MFPCAIILQIEQLNNKTFSYLFITKKWKQYAAKLENEIRYTFTELLYRLLREVYVITPASMYPLDDLNVPFNPFYFLVYLFRSINLSSFIRINVESIHLQKIQKNWQHFFFYVYEKWMFYNEVQSF